MRIRRVWIMAFALWSIPAVGFTALLMLEPENPVARSVFGAFLQLGAPWYYWAVVTPLILSVSRHIPFDGRPRFPQLLLHAWMGVIGGYFFGVFWTIILMFGPPPGAPDAFSLPHLLRSMIIFVPFGLAIYGTLASIGYATDFYRRLRERELIAVELQSQLKDAQLGALRMQLQPHFLFNTLNTIAMLVREGETQTSVRMLARLSDLLRHLLEDEGDQEVPIREELDFLGRYLEIEQLRFQDRLRVEIVVEEGTRDAFVPNLVLQPIIENAIRHGISSRAAAGEIELRVARENGSLLVSVRDDGPGLAPGFSMDDLTGIGLRNTVARLQHLYGGAGSIDIRNAPVQGTLVTLRIPYHETPVTTERG
ncbi:MAG: histidine kinase [Longimicrobiales bacterium]